MNQKSVCIFGDCQNDSDWFMDLICPLEGKDEEAAIFTKTDLGVCDRHVKALGIWDIFTKKEWEKFSRQVKEVCSTIPDKRRARLVYRERVPERRSITH